MERVLCSSNMEELSDHLWPSFSDNEDEDELSKMNRSTSEWSLQCFLQQQQQHTNEVEDVKVNSISNISSSSASFFKGHNVHVESEEDYQALLKTKLDLACAAVALSRVKASLVKAQDSSSDALQPGSQDPSQGAGNDLCRSYDKSKNAPFGIPALPAIRKRPPAPIRQATSGSSDDEEVEVETGMTGNMGRADMKRARRMLSNRESARRSRSRKQTYLTDLETQAAQLRVENSSLLKRLTEINQKCDGVAVDNRVLKADIETLRTKVKMAEETVKRLTATSPLFHTTSDMSSSSMAPFDGSPSETSTDAAVTVQDDPNHHYFQPACNSSMLVHDFRGNTGLADETPSVENAQQTSAATSSEVPGNKMGRTPSLQRVDSLERLQKRIRGGEQ